MEIRFISVGLCLLLGICEGNSTCTHSIPHGEITWWCDVGDSLCPYSCDEGYQEHEEVSWVSCTSAGIWGSPRLSGLVTEAALCTPKSCPSTIPHGNLSSGCSAKVDTTCGFVCNDGFQPRAGINSITCQTSTNWSVNPHSLCSSNNQCPYELANGELDLSCLRSPGETCNYMCRLGYLPSKRAEPTTVTCGNALSWSKPLSSLCQKIECPPIIPNGYIPSHCRREYRSSCYNYECDTGYIKAESRPPLDCNATGEWDWPRSAAKTLCSREEDLCPSKIKNGHIIWHCSRQAGATCTYDCDAGCTESSPTWLTCQDDASWNTITDNLCKCDGITETVTTRAITTTATLTTALFSSSTTSHSTTEHMNCPSVIPNGRIAYGCALVPGYTCGYICYSGCSPTLRSLFCHVNGSWGSENTACDCQHSTTEHMSCPSTIPNGIIEYGCDLVPGYVCGYSCNSGCSPTFRSLFCHVNGSWGSENTACDCQGQSTFEPPVQCSSEIPNGRISRSCSRARESYCDYTCYVGCTRTRDYLYCASNGLWVFESGACDCGVGEKSDSNIGVIVGSVVGASVLIIIIVTVVCLKCRRQQSQMPNTAQTAQGTIHRPVVYPKPTNQNTNAGVSMGMINQPNPAYAVMNTGQRTGVENPYHYYMEVVDSPNMRTGASNPVAAIPSSQTRHSGQYASLQVNDYLTPYSALQPTSRTGPVTYDVANEYARIGDISSETPEHGYSVLHGNNGEPQEPPPTYEPQDRDQNPPPTYEESQTVAAIQQSLKEL